MRLVTNPGDITAPDHQGLSSQDTPTRIQRLAIAYGPNATTARYTLLPRAGLVIGRTPAPDVYAVDDPGVSRRHVRLAPEGDTWFAQDAGSTNGLHVDGVRVNRARLQHGSVLRMGSTLLVFLDEMIQSIENLAGETPQLVGQSLALQRVRGEIGLVAGRSVPVMVSGATGTGKECVAAELHRQSGRSGRFVPVNCAALPENLAESELFGHVAGAFTGALGKHEGLFQAAAGGTIFLDEVGELPVRLQAKLLRVLSDGEVRPVGSARAEKVDARVVSATLRDVQALIESGDFRGDLFARLAGWSIRLPPLRERRDDILPLAERFAADASLPARLSVGAAEALLLHAWPFNVRELRQVVQNAALRADGGLVRSRHLPAELTAHLPRDVSARAAEVEPEPPLTLLVDPRSTPSGDDLRRVLRYFRGNVLDIAEYFGRHRRQVYRWLDRHEIDPDSFREA